MKKNHFIILTVVSLILIISTVVAIYLLQVQSPEESSNVVEDKTDVVAEEAKPKPVELKFSCPLDGAATSEEQITKRPLAIMIENHMDARPQSGLEKACIVYETVAEGGITRFMAIFLHGEVEMIGPVRSAREYFVDLAKQYDAVYAHCGGPFTIYDVIKNLRVANLDEFTNSDAYWRIRSRKAPHNLYTSTSNLRSKAEKRGYDNEVFFQRPNFKDDEPIENRPSSFSIDINFSKPAFAVRYEYDRQTNRYGRIMGGQPHIDNLYERQIAPKNIVVQFTPISSIANDPKGRLRVSLIGSGQAIVFQDGKAIQATWQRPTLTDLTRLYNSTGNEIKLNRGQTWIELVDPDKMQVKYP